jgi:prepilin-type N-terminal cleavage/methylation domain-containing protein
MVIFTGSQKHHAFTLLELLIVISIIGILVTVATASYTSSQQKARNSRRMSDMKSVQNAAEQYYADHDGTYPADTSFGPTYLPAGWPTDPKSDRSYVYTPSAAMDAYFACAEMEGTVGNAAGADGSGYPTSGGAYYCVKGLQ